jgi:hypothetical protein
MYLVLLLSSLKEQLDKELVPEDLMELDQVRTLDDCTTPVHDSGNDTEGMEERVVGRTTSRNGRLAFWIRATHFVLAGTMIGLVTVPEAPLTPKLGGRGTDTKPRAKRGCQ